MARKTITGKDPGTGEDLEFLFRVPTVKDFWIVKGDLPIPEVAAKATGASKRRKKKAVDPEVAVQDSLTVLEMADRMMMRCQIRPKLLDQVVEDVPEGAVCIEELDPMWRMEVFTKLTEGAGLTPQEVDETVGP